MGVAGTITPTGGAPKPDPARVAALRYTLVDEPETCAAFGEAARANLASLNDRTLAETRSGDLAECGLLLDHVRDRVAGLDPNKLQPRSGLAGLFDSRGKRLKGFRAAYASTAAALGQSAADIGDRAGALARKDAALETLWSETRDAIAELDAHIAAARGWLANESPTPVVEEAAAPQPTEEMPERCEAQADAEAQNAPVAEAVTDAEPVETTAVTASEDTPEPEPTPVAALPHPLESRLATLEAVRATAIGRLPLLRAAQNADCRTPASLKQVCDGVEAWRADWQDALGLAGKRPKKVRPDRIRLGDASTALTDRIQAAGRELSAAQARRAELDARAAPARTPATATALAA
ncbi:toxic anion resistance protein [Brevundimonas staleyi]|uniref:Toxic anion resistance protein n=1 Tax=Brevundimonas staleyi TaxID=74326 RepID=A0ABW0FYJ0_9CAUL